MTKKPYRNKAILTEGGEKRWTVTKDYLPYDPFERFLKFKWEKSSGDGENTTESYARNLAEFANFLHSEGYDWWQVNSEIVSSYVEWVKRDGPTIGNVRNIRRATPQESAYKPRSINQRTATILSCFDFHKAQRKFAGIDLRTWTNAPPHSITYKAEYEGIKTQRGAGKRTNPFKQKVPTEPAPILEPDEVQWLVDSCSFIRDKLLITTMYDAGLRIGEALGLRIEDIDPMTGDINVVSRHNVNNARVKNESERSLPCLSDEGVSLFVDYLGDEYPEEIDTDYLFVVLEGDTRGAALIYDTAYKMIMRKRPKFTEKFGHEKAFSPHWLRHSFGTDSMEHDETGGRATQELMGHKQLQTTTGIYNHPRKEVHKERMNKIHETRKKSAEKRKHNKGESTDV